MTASDEDSPRLVTRHVAGEIVLAAVVTVVAVGIHVTGADAVPVNRPPDAWSVLLTVASVAPLALRRRRPLPVLAASFPGPLLLILGHYSVGATPLGVAVTFYTAVAWGSRREARAAVPLLLIGIGVAAALRPIDLSIEGALVQLALYIGGWVLGTGVRERRDLQGVREAQARRDVELAQQAAELERERASRAAAEERLRITRELHDVLGHAFSVMVVQAGAAEQLLDADPPAVRAALREIAGTGRSSLADIRRVLGQLREGEPHVRPEPSPSLADVPALVARVEAAGLRTVLRLQRDLENVSAGIELAAYRVVQEALTNCLRHASATHADVFVGLSGGPPKGQAGDAGSGEAVLRIEIQDDGVGVAPGDDGQGLKGMRERVSVYGGVLDAGPAPGRGYRVSASIPLTAGVEVGAA